MTENLDEKGYNGWRNKATWLVLLHADEDHDRQRLETLAAQFVRQENDIIKATYALAEYLKDEYTRKGYYISPGVTFWNALISSALSDIDWDNIAGHLIEDCGEEREEDEEEEEEEDE